MNSDKNRGAFIYQGNALVVPEGTAQANAETSDKAIDEINFEISSELIEEAFCDILPDADRFFVPALDRGEAGMHCVSLPKGELPPGWKAVNMRQVFNTITGGKPVVGYSPLRRMLRSHHLALWRGEAFFCGSCGAPYRDSETEPLVKECTACGRLEYPRISPAVITIVINDNGEALLAHNKKFVPGLYSLIAGFNEAGENLEETVTREIMEEVCLEVKDIRYVCSQPWPFPNALMMAFTARHKAGEIKPDGIEIEDAQWFPKDRLPDLPGHGTVSRYLIERWLNGKL